MSHKIKLVEGAEGEYAEVRLDQTMSDAEMYELKGKVHLRYGDQITHVTLIDKRGEVVPSLAYAAEESARRRIGIRSGVRVSGPRGFGMVIGRVNGDLATVRWDAGLRCEERIDQLTAI